MSRVSGGRVSAVIAPPFATSDVAAATKTHTAYLLILYLHVGVSSGARNQGAGVSSLPAEAQKVLESRWEGAERYRYVDHMVVTSRGYNLATAQEAAPKLIGTTHIVAGPFSEADLRHGPTAMLAGTSPW